MVRILSVLFLVMAFMAPLSVQAQDTPIGSIVVVEGEGALILRAAESGKAYVANADDTVYRNDVLQTGPGGRMSVLLIDDSQFTLGENAAMKVDEYIYDDEDDTNNKGRYNMLRGTFLYVSGLVAKKDTPDVKITTPYGGIGIRGTTVWGGPLDDEYNVFVSDGEVTVETNRGRIRMVKGEGTIIRNANSIPERAKVWGQPKITRATDTVSIRDVVKAKERVAFHQQNRQDMVLKNREVARARFKNVPVTPRDKSIKEIRPLHQKIEERKDKPEERKDNIQQPLREKILERKDDALPEKKSQSSDAVTPQQAGFVTPEAQTQPAAAIAAPVAPAAPVVAAPAPPAVPAPQAVTAPAAAATVLPAVPQTEPPAPARKEDMPFPKPDPVAVPIPEDLPSDPAMREEALERQRLQNQPPPEQPAPPAKKSWNPF